jgi:phenylpropionate dioxygenase-like ring-hydroxylating dioxygenase large terminal subunit
MGPTFMAEAGTPADIGHATTVDRRMIVDPDWFEAELEHVFARSWLFVGHDTEIPNAGDYVTRTMGRDPVIMVRDESAHVHVLLNSCQHRGTQICKADLGNTAHFRCGYHGWMYANDGRLVAVPAQKKVYSAEHFDRQACSLPSARVAIHHGFVYATWSADIEPFEDHLGDVAWYLDALLALGPGGWEAYGPPARFLLQGNWKVPLENIGGDGYHLAVAHKTMYDAGSLGRASNTESVVQGHTFATDRGHALRVVHPIINPDKPLYLGLPDDFARTIDAAVTPEQRSFLSGSAVIHGQLFPNCGFIKVVFFTSGESADQPTAFMQWRVYNPAGPRTTEALHWTMVPAAAPEDWKRESYKFSARTHTGGALFEGDDVENFARIDAANRGVVALRYPALYTLGVGVDAKDLMDWRGPGRVEPKNYSEVASRALYGRVGQMIDEAST